MWKAISNGKDFGAWFEPERLLAFTWIPYELPTGADPSGHPTTRIEFRLDEIANGTRLTVVESGFAKLPPDKQYKRVENAEGWAIQVHAIAQHVLGRIDVRVEDRIARPLPEVMEAIVDPAKMVNYFISRGSARMTNGAVVEWEWGDVGAKGCSLRAYLVHRINLRTGQRVA